MCLHALWIRPATSSNRSKVFPIGSIGHHCARVRVTPKVHVPHFWLDLLPPEYPHETTPDRSALAPPPRYSPKGSDFGNQQARQAAFGDDGVHRPKSGCDPDLWNHKQALRYPQRIGRNYPWRLGSRAVTDAVRVELERKITSSRRNPGKVQIDDHRAGGIVGHLFQHGCLLDRGARTKRRPNQVIGV